MDELESIVDFGRFNPTINPVFSHTVGSEFMSTSLNASSVKGAKWQLSFYDGSVSVHNISSLGLIRAVRNNAK